MSIKVAIIEDSKAYVSEVSHYLKTHDIEIVNIGYNGKEALEILNTDTFDVLLLDLILPHIDDMTLACCFVNSVTSTPEIILAISSILSSPTNCLIDVIVRSFTVSLVMYK